MQIPIDETIRFLKQRDILNTAIGELEGKISALRQTILEVSNAENTGLTDRYHQQALSQLEQLESKNDALSKKRQLIDCLLDAGDSEEEARDCQERVLS